MSLAAALIFFRSTSESMPSCWQSASHATGLWDAYHCPSFCGKYEVLLAMIFV